MSASLRGRRALGLLVVGALALPWTAGIPRPVRAGDESEPGRFDVYEARRRDAELLQAKEAEVLERYGVRRGPDGTVVRDARWRRASEEFRDFAEQQRRLAAADGRRDTAFDRVLGEAGMDGTAVRDTGTPPGHPDYRGRAGDRDVTARSPEEARRIAEAAGQRYRVRRIEGGYVIEELDVVVWESDAPQSRTRALFEPEAVQAHGEPGVAQHVKKVQGHLTSEPPTDVLDQRRFVQELAKAGYKVGSAVDPDGKLGLLTAQERATFHALKMGQDPRGLLYPVGATEAEKAEALRGLRDRMNQVLRDGLAHEQTTRTQKMGDLRERIARHRAEIDAAEARGDRARVRSLQRQTARDAENLNRLELSELGESLTLKTARRMNGALARVFPPGGRAERAWRAFLGGKPLTPGKAAGLSLMGRLAGIWDAWKAEAQDSTRERRPMSGANVTGRAAANLLGITQATTAWDRMLYEAREGQVEAIHEEILRAEREGWDSGPWRAWIRLKALPTATVRATWAGVQGLPLLGDVVTGVETGVGYVAELGSTWEVVRQAAATAAVQRAAQAETVADALESLSLSATDLEGRSRAAQRLRARLDAIALQCRDLDQRIEGTSGLLAQARDAARAAAPEAPPPAPLPDRSSLGALLGEAAQIARESADRRVACEQIEREARGGQLGAAGLRTRTGFARDLIERLVERATSAHERALPWQQAATELEDGAAAGDIAEALRGELASYGRQARRLAAEHAATLGELIATRKEFESIHARLRSAPTADYARHRKGLVDGLARLRASLATAPDADRERLERLIDGTRDRIDELDDSQQSHGDYFASHPGGTSEQRSAFADAMGLIGAARMAFPDDPPVECGRAALAHLADVAEALARSAPATSAPPAMDAARSARRTEARAAVARLDPALEAMDGALAAALAALRRLEDLTGRGPDVGATVPPAGSGAAGRLSEAQLRSLTGDQIVERLRLPAILGKPQEGESRYGLTYSGPRAGPSNEPERPPDGAYSRRAYAGTLEAWTDRDGDGVQGPDEAWEALPLRLWLCTNYVSGDWGPMHANVAEGTNRYAVKRVDEVRRHWDAEQAKRWSAVEDLGIGDASVGGLEASNQDPACYYRAEAAVGPLTVGLDLRVQGTLGGEPLWGPGTPGWPGASSTLVHLAQPERLAALWKAVAATRWEVASQVLEEALAEGAQMRAYSFQHHLFDVRALLVELPGFELRRAHGWDEPQYDTSWELSRPIAGATTKETYHVSVKAWFMDDDASWDTVLDGARAEFTNRLSHDPYRGQPLLGSRFDAERAAHVRHTLEDRPGGPYQSWENILVVCNNVLVRVSGHTFRAHVPETLAAPLMQALIARIRGHQPPQLPPAR